ncbi:sulfite exporter TauE/SafE family protein [Variovorax sp. RTB1]|uniref:sulfite exporter TauE/SafE family protein n=1 Tax=Variovorax sp. RTB1 TaxID=3048631 RepID=UPI0019BD5B19|nr:sulfite exporter TauE/SafE family protein [Variovorax sp. RTB1]MBC7704860.1 sulfite exporter TauE/SafE family protein [Rhodoferax sp.]MEB0114102.1 sulfite exporter TauE/SafE family protein [Variovorax sp. RTB1]
MLISALLGILVGAILGLTGAGGGILAVPALVVGMGWPMQQAAPVALIAVAGGAALGAAEGFRKKLVRYKAALLMAVAGIPVTGFGIRTAHMLSQRVLLALFACVMLIVATRLILQARHAASGLEAGRLGRINPATGRFEWTWITAVLLAAIGALTGFMTGLLGVGGGFVIVPLLRRFTDVSMHGIVATSLLVIALVGIGGVATSMLHGTDVPVAVTVYFSLATAAGMMLGRLASSRLSARHVQQGFALVLVVVATGLLGKAFYAG